MLVLNKLLRTLLTLQRYRTVDKGSVDVLTAEKIGPKRAKTPEGFLLCQDVPVARVGTMLYGAGEVPIEPGVDGLSHVTRDAAALFDSKTLASYVGKPVVDDHPDEDVTPQNWKDLAIGIVLNPRRGVGDDSDVMLADLLITDADAIRDVEAGKREVSAGYEADYEQTGPGQGRQTNIIGNHVALVERGRCGVRCSIGDHQHKESKEMAKTQKATRLAQVTERIRAVFKDAGEELAQSLPEAMGDEDEGSGDTHIHVHTGAADPGQTADEGALGAGGDPAAAVAGDPGADKTEARLVALETTVSEIKGLVSKLVGGGGEGAAGGEADEVQAQDGMPEEVLAAQGAKTNDSMALETSFKAVLADAEVLVPGFRIPTFDAKAKRKATMDAMCSLRRGVLNTLAATNDGAALLAAVGGNAAATADCAAVASAFRAAAGAKRLLNNSAGTRDAHRMPNGATAAPTSKPPLTLAELNKMHAKYHTTA